MFSHQVSQGYILRESAVGNNSTLVADTLCFPASPVSLRYYLSTKASLIRMYVDRPYWEAFNVDGRQCENIVDCKVRQLTSDDCPYDFIKLYDGVDEFSPLIGKFCGIGSFPVSIIGTTNKLFLEFVTSKHGPLINTGFDFRLTSVPGTGSSMVNGTCHQTVTSKDLNGNDEGSFISLEHWYKPGKNCSYLLKGTETQIVRLHFEKMKISQKDQIKKDNNDCSEHLVLYDSTWPNPQKIIKAFCNGFSQPKENIDFVTAGPNMFINYVSTSGSYSGSSIYYWAIYDFHEALLDGERVQSTVCDELLDTSGNEVKQFRSPRNTLVYKNAKEDISCRYFISANKDEYARVALEVKNINIKKTKGSCSKCWGNTALDRIEIIDPSRSMNFTDSCYSSCSKNKPKIIFSQGTQLQLQLSVVQRSARSNYFKKKKPIFRAEYHLLHPPVCGPTQIPGKESGVISFPILKDKTINYTDVECLWDLSVQLNKPLVLSVRILQNTIDIILISVFRSPISLSSRILVPTTQLR